MLHLTDGPSMPVLLQPGIVVLDRAQSLESCCAVARLLDMWLQQEHSEPPDKPQGVVRETE